MGVSVGGADGRPVEGYAVGFFDGEWLGRDVGCLVGFRVLGFFVGVNVGDRDGASDGERVDV